MDIFEFGGLLYEQEAEKAFERQAEIEEAAIWCKSYYPHKFEFLNVIRNLLIAEERQYARLGLSAALRTGVVKLQPVLAILTPSQALRLLESYKRAIADDPKIWRAKKIEEIEKLEADKRRDTVVAEVRAELARRKQPNAE